jgi:hypothetical protein
VQYQHNNRGGTVVPTTKFSLLIGLCLVMNQRSQAAVDWNNYESCKECHADIYKEWESTRHAQAWKSKQFTEQSQNRTKADCLPCHAPKPIFETGIGKECVLRDDNRDAGVTCITCHRQNKTSVGPIKNTKADCNPEYTGSFEDNTTCQMCHKNTSEEWKTSSFSHQGKNYATCAKCHMKPVKRAAAKNGIVREVYPHITYGGHDTKAVQEAVRDMTVTVQDGKAHISLTNDLTGHSLPSGTNGRQLLIMTAIKDENDKTVEMHREVFEKGDNKDKKDTSIPVDKKIELVYDCKVPSGEVVVKILYKSVPSQKDREAAEVTEKKASF